MSFPITQTWIEINKNAFDHNIASLHTIAEHQKIAVVVKANAYGHGISEIAQLCQQNPHVHMLCTVSISEALHLRSIGITKPILVLGIFDRDPAYAIAQNIEFVIHDATTVQQLNAIAQNLQVQCKIHLKIDTGLSRLGIAPNDALAFVQFIQTLSHVQVYGICSHFAESPKEDITYTLHQYQQFHSVLETLKMQNIEIPYRHIANTSGSLSFDFPDTSLIRVGACAYGLIPSNATLQRVQAKHPDFSLQPALSWHARIMHIRTIPAGSAVGYDRRFTTNRTTKIAFLPIGYTDGYSKRLSNKSQVLIKKQNVLAPVIGRIAMNMTSIDVTDIPDIAVGDEVLILGDHPMINAIHLAELIESYNPREFTAGLSMAIRREITTESCIQFSTMQKQNSITGKIR